MANLMIPRNVKLIRNIETGVWHFDLGTGTIHTGCGKKELRGTARPEWFITYNAGTHEVRHGDVCKVCNRYARSWGWGVAK